MRVVTATSSANGSAAGTADYHFRTIDATDRLRRAYATLRALQNAITDPGGDVREAYVQEYHRQLAGLQEATSIDLTEFRVPDSELELPVIDADSYGNPTRYGRERFADPGFVLAKINAVLGYFDLMIPETKPRDIGFRPPRQ